jgi:hypothetical protein
MQNNIVPVIQSCHADGFYKGAQIPPKKLQNALANYPVPASETPLALVDATVFGSAKVGMVLGAKGIYWKNDWATDTLKNFLSWEELASAPELIRAKSSKLTLAQGCVFDMTGSSMKGEQLAGLLLKIVDLFAREASDEGEKPQPAPARQADAREAPAQPAMSREMKIARTGNELEMAILRFKTIFRLLDHAKARPIAEYAMEYFEVLHEMIRNGEELDQIKRESDLILELSDHFIEVSHGRQTLRKELLAPRQDDSEFILILRSLLVAKQEIMQEEVHDKKVDDFMKW